MTSVISTQSNQWRLYNEFYNDKSYYCDVTVKIEKKKYIDNKIFYYISYLYSFSEESFRCYNLVPLNKDEMDGEIIAVNSLSDKICEYLLMSMEELENYSGSVSAQFYKKSLMKIVSHLSD